MPRPPTSPPMGRPPTTWPPAWRPTTGSSALVRAGADFETVTQAAERRRPGRERTRGCGRTASSPGRGWTTIRAPALERIAVPILALFGGSDLVVPVDESVAVFEAARRAGRAP